jgi:hypothetical protein
MSEENVELVRRGHEAFRDSGEEAIFQYLHADIDLTPAVELPGAEAYHGHDGRRSTRAAASSAASSGCTPDAGCSAWSVSARGSCLSD